MMEVNLFDSHRISGMDALRYSKKWFSHPHDTAMSLTYNLMRQIGHAIPTERDQHGVSPYESIQQSLYNNSLLVGRWAMSGYPVVTMGHRTAAAFMATKIKNSDVEEFVRIPWPAFCIRLPTPLLTIDENGKAFDASMILVTSSPGYEFLPHFGNEHRWWYKMVASVPYSEYGAAAQLATQTPGLLGYFAGVSLWGFNTPSSRFIDIDGGGLFNEDGSHDPGYVKWETVEKTSCDERSDYLCRLLIIATCLHLSGSPDQRAKMPVQEGIEIKHRTSKSRPNDTLPTYEEYAIKSSIKINLHHAMRDFVTHGGSTPAVQSLVAGHWKRVAFGKGRENRRLQHILPYWRGDIDAPISMRSK